MRIKRATVLSVVIFLCLIPGLAREEGGTSHPSSSLHKSSQDLLHPAQTAININNYTVWVRGDGYHGQPIDGSWNGTFPKGTAGAIYSDGILWGSSVQDGQSTDIRIGGNTHTPGLQAGAILTDALGNVTGPEEWEGAAADTIRPYRVRPDFQTADLTDDAANFYIVAVEDVTSSQTEAIYDQYEYDWLHWRWTAGAPFDDRGDADGNPGTDDVYTPDPDGDGVFAEVEVNEDGDTLYIEDIPGIPDAHQTLWTVYNDLNINFYESPSTGMEVQETYWAYAVEPPLGNTVFKRARFFYKGTTETPPDAYLQDAFITQWSDQDLGQYTDDYLGCDTTLSLGYVYNSSNSDAVWDAWQMASPAAGYDFFQGPLVEGQPGEDINKNGVDDAEDWGIFDLQPVGPGLVNLPMTTHTFFAAGSQRTDPDGDYNGTLQWYNLMRGCEPRPQYPDCDPLYDENGNETHFELAGDPVTGIGDLDGRPTAENPMRFPPGDRRMVISSGPFDMALGETQEVVIAMIAAQGGTYLQSVDLLKFYDGKVQEAYDNLFDLPSPPQAPKLRIIELNQELILEWESNPGKVEATESHDSKGYTFEGYNVYQLPTSTSPKEDAELLATFDLVNEVTNIYQDVFSLDFGAVINVPVIQATNTGIQRYYRITEDIFTGEPIINGNSYYFAVTAFSKNMSPAVATHVLESPLSLSLLSGKPHFPNPQTFYPNDVGDTLTIHNTVGFSDAIVYPVITDPEAAAAQEYDIQFQVDEGGSKTWSLVRIDTTDTLLSDIAAYNPYNVTNVIGVDTVYRFPGDYGGFNLFVQDGPQGIKSVTEGGVDVLENPSPSGDYNITGTLDDFPGGKIDEDNYEIRFTSDGSWVLAAPTPSIPLAYWMRAPFEVWDLGLTESDTDDVQLFAYVHDVGSDTTWNTEGNAEVAGNPVFDKIEIAKDPDAPILYNEDTDSVSLQEKAKIVIPNSFKALVDIGFVDLTGTGAGPVSGTTVLFETYKGIQNGDIKTFKLGIYLTEETGELAKGRIKDIIVYPNPYMGMHEREVSTTERYVTISHLPRRAIIRLYSLAGVLVRTIEKDDETQFAKWNLTNDFNLPVASGMYIAHIEMPDLNEEVVLKLAIIQEEQYLRTY